MIEQQSHFYDYPIKSIRNLHELYTRIQIHSHHRIFTDHKHVSSYIIIMNIVISYLLNKQVCVKIYFATHSAFYLHRHLTRF